MKIWLPYIQAGTGADISTSYLATGLRDRGHDTYKLGFNRRYEFAPWLLRSVKPPTGCDAIITNTWNGFAFARTGIPMVTVDRLFVLDPALGPYKTPAQRFYHNVFIRQFVKRSAQSANRVVSVSEYTADIFAKQLGLPRPTVILNAVDTDFFSPPPQPRRIDPSQPRRLLYVGTLSRRKGTDLLAPIMRQLGDAYQLYYTGSADASVLGKDEPSNMHELGRLNQKEIRDQYRQAHLLVFPSRGEGLARAIMEALACGTPVVAGNISSMPEAVDEQVGQLCSPDDVSAFVEAITAVTVQDSTWQGLSVAARQRAKERFCLKRLLSEFEAVLAQVAAR
ncbi:MULTISPECIES: glycosyltransferase family 4 protein [unclassified Ectothiorhodospira]|uniref:glycosyltransferase family 4 protein n=1 Tax=unclassified Ectothiorhodospira TaxID=2684909 RepID=UPI001EE89E0A|nr:MULTISPECIES: glycosyltransferase family 4 protein [unclassified Ectothiorhodospira]MCG5516953.1 glycosyltransferase family 4 protein [Ectothiorhodospira sp. 9100]MCG5519871.1 glycosyltransferase family 4 protein [Ectothiorhodospira sp. 9905]